MDSKRVQLKKFDEFDVYYINEGHSFIYADFNNPDKFMDGLTDYLFNENNLLNYARRISRIQFTGEDRQYVRLYNNIGMFLNSNMETLVVGMVTDELKNVLGEEYNLIDDKGELKVQKDKIGKIGEYAFHLLLTNFFQLDCILPKFTCTTDRNMSVFGIDTLFLDTREKIIYFGESKFSKDIDNGIKLVNRSLDEYEKQIREEYRYVLSNDVAFNLSPEFNAIYGEEKQFCISFEELIKRAKIQFIGVPIFIAHGNGTSGNLPENYIDKLMNKVKRKQFFGINTKYILISLPVIDKTQFIEKAIVKVVKKQNEYGQRARGC